MQLRITGPRADALRFALDLAAQDQREYIHSGHPERDHGEEWPAAAQRKAKQFRQLADIAERIGEDSIAAAYRELANDATTHADYHARKRAEIQRRTQAPAHYRGPDLPPAYRTVKTLDGPAPAFCECGRSWDDCSTRDDDDPDAQHQDRTT